MGLLVLLAACRAEIARDLDQPGATRVAAALDEAGVPAQIVEASPSSPGSFAVLVPSTELERARVILNERGLPPEPRSSLADLYDGAGLLPTPLEERARLVDALGGELSRTLESIDGVTSARVHLSVDPRPRTLGEPSDSESLSASVLIRHTGHASPVDVLRVQELVAGAVTGLSPENVTVVMVEVPERSGSRQTQLASLGPFVVSPGSLPALRVWFASTLVVAALLAALVIALALRLRRLRAALAERRDSR